MSKRNLAPLSPVELREVWEDEAGDFTPWLAEEENLNLLGETLGMDLELESTERAVGRFSADIVAKDVNDGGTVLIKHQHGRTDHSHLGQILTCAAGLDALSVVWIAREFTDEHRAALDWLNDISNENIRFFGLEIEVWRIGDSRHAPKFNLAAKPNDWTKETRTRISLMPTQQARLDFWTGFHEHAVECAQRIRPTRPLRQTRMEQGWLRMPVGRTGFSLRAVAVKSPRRLYGQNAGPEIRAEFVVRDSHSHFARLCERRKEIETAFGEPLEWGESGALMQRIICVRRSLDWTEESRREEAYRWLVEKLDKLHEVFSPRIKAL